MSTASVSIPARSASTSFTAVYATATAITFFSAVSSAPTPIYRFYREALGLTPFVSGPVIGIEAVCR
jgi:hypothetical protein